METNVIKTLDWSECGVQLTALAVKTFGHPKRSTATDFAEFIRFFAADHKLMAAFLEKNAKRHSFEDCSSIATISEDACLFSCKPASALEIIFRHLKTLNTGGRLPALWSFLDEDCKAVVHFVNRKGWYAEAFFSCDEDFSALHLLEGENGISFLPAVFAKDIAPYASLAEGFLQTYLPRETFEFLSNKSGMKKKGKKSTLPAGSPPSAQKDKDDFL